MDVMALRRSVIAGCYPDNVWDGQWETGQYNNSGSPTTASTRIRSKNPIRVFENTTYIYDCNSGSYSGNLKMIFLKHDKSANGIYDFNATHTFTTPAGTAYMLFFTGSAYGGVYNGDIFFRYSMR